MENAFGILKKTFKQLLVKSNLHTIFLLDVVICCLLYNMILNERDVDVNALMQQLIQEDLQGGIRRHQHHRMDAGHNEEEANLDCIELLGSNQRVTLLKHI